MMRRAVMLASVVVLGACASAKSGTAAPDLSTQRVGSQSIVAGSGSASVALRSEAVASSSVVDLSPDKAFAALESAYIALGIPISEKLPAKRQLGNPAFRARRKLGDLQLTKLVDCGGDSGMPNAETYILTLSISSVVSANAAGGSVVQTVLEGDGKNPLTNAATNVRCGSLGELEKRIVMRMKAAPAK